MFDIGTPVGLQDKCIFDVIYYFGRRAKEGLRAMGANFFDFQFDANGIEYCIPRANELDKNHQQAELQNKIMYSQPGNPACPVLSLHKYIDVLNPNNPNLWQKPKHFGYGNGVWFTKQPVGEHTLGDKMSTWSEQFGLSQRYTNHCIRATVINVLGEAGVQDRYILTVTGQKSEQTLKHYQARTSNKKTATWQCLGRSSSCYCTGQFCVW